MLVIFLGRHLLGLRSQIFLVAGVLKMPRWKFVLADAISAMITLSIMAGAGYWGGSTLERIKNGVEDAGHALIVLILIVIVALLIWRLAVRKIGQDVETGD